MVVIQSELNIMTSFAEKDPPKASQLYHHYLLLELADPVYPTQQVIRRLPA